MTPDDLADLLDDERSGSRRDILELTLADRLDDDGDGLFGRLD